MATKTKLHDDVQTDDGRELSIIMISEPADDAIQIIARFRPTRNPTNQEIGFEQSGNY